MYDFIIIEVGTAGATIAARLSEISHIEVLLIEAGSSENLVMDIPVLSHFLQLSGDINWKYRTGSSNKYCLDIVNNRCNWLGGRVIDGGNR